MEFCNITFTGLNKVDLFKPTNNGKAKIIVTVNASLITIANTSSRFMDLCNNSFSTFDGEIPLKIARLLHPKKVIDKISGSDIIYDFCEYAQRTKLKVFFLGGREDSNKSAVEKIRSKYLVQISGYSPQYENYPFSCSFIENCIQRLEQFQPDILFIGFGAPKQEFFIQDHYEQLSKIGIKFIVGCGGSIDFVSEKIQRAPKTIQKIGLEGLYRLIKEPNRERLKRILVSFMFLQFLFRKPK